MRGATSRNNRALSNGAGAMLILLLVFLIQPTVMFAQKTAAEWLKDAQGLFQARDRAAARRALESAIDCAVQERDRQLEAQARFSLGSALSQDAQYDTSNVQLRAAL